MTGSSCRARRCWSPFITANVCRVAVLGVLVTTIVTDEVNIAVVLTSIFLLARPSSPVGRTCTAQTPTETAPGTPPQNLSRRG